MKGEVLLSCFYREDEYVLHGREWLGGVSSSPVSGAKCGECVRRRSGHGFLIWSAYSHEFPKCVEVGDVGVGIYPRGWVLREIVAGRCPAWRCNRAVR